MSVKNPLVSVIIPVYNAEIFLSDCIDSILHQSYKNIELILVNDGSQDMSSVICDNYAKDNSRIKVLHQDNSGVSSARNNGLKLATGEFIMFVDSDDLMAPNGLSTMISHTNSRNIDCISGGMTHIDTLYSPDKPTTEIHSPSTRKKNSDIQILSRTEAIKSMLYQKRVINAPFAKLWRSDAVRKVSYPEDLTYAEDLRYNYDCLIGTNKTVAINDSVYLYRIHEGSAMSATFSLKRMDSIRVLKEIATDSKPGDALYKATRNRLFMEAIYIGILITNKKDSAHLETCKQIIKDYRHLVLHDKSSKIQYRILALTAYLSPSIIWRTANIRKKLKRTLKK